VPGNEETHTTILPHPSVRSFLGSEADPCIAKVFQHRLVGVSTQKRCRVQVGLWAFGVLAHGRLVEAGRVAGCVFLAFVSVAAALGFLVYGGRLFLMLQRFPIESRGRTKKLREVRFPWQWSR